MKRSFIFLVFLGFIFAMGSIGCKKSAAGSPEKGTIKKAKQTGKKKLVLYTVQPNKSSLAKGTKGKASFNINLFNGGEIHAQAPFKCMMTASSGLSISKKTLGHKDVIAAKDHKSVTLSVGIIAKQKGKQYVKFDCSFFICTKDICARHQEKIQSNIMVK